MDQNVLTIIFAVAAALCAILFYSLSRSRGSELAKVRENFAEKDSKIESLTSALQATKEQLAKKKKDVESLQVEARKKAKKEGKRQQREIAALSTSGRSESSSMTPEEQARKSAAMSNAIQAQLDNLEREHQDRLTEATGELKNTISEQKKELKELNQKFKEFRVSTQKRDEERRNLPNTTIDVSTLDDAVRDELARYYRKGESFEKMYKLVSGQHRALGDQMKELRTKYFALCRELALRDGGSPSTDIVNEKVPPAVEVASHTASESEPVAVEA